ncbi:MAG: hypothetical protein AAB225_26795 [Acidobacteriota bacterium]
MNSHYDVQEWAAATTRGRQVFNYGYRLTANDLKGWKLLKVVTLQEGRDLTDKAYIFQSTSDPEHEMVRVGITERNHWRLAQESLHQHLMNCMRSDIPRGTKQLAQVGDVIFVGREPQTDIAGAISFTRGNVCVVVSSAGAKSVDVSGIAVRLDRALSEPPAKAELDKGLVRARTPKTAAVTANRPFVLIEKLPEAARGGWLKVIVPDGELSRKGDGLIYVSPQGGEKRVDTFAARRS